MNLEERIRFARGDAEVDLVLTNCYVVDVLSGRIHPAQIAIADGIIVGLDSGYRARKTIDLKGKYLAPGLIDCHVHIESSMVSVQEFAGTIMPRGTTSVIIDCHEIGNVMGIAGIRYMMDSAAKVPLDIFFMLPSCVPATPFETSGAVLEAADLKPLIDEPAVLGLGELMNFPGTIAGDPGVLAKLELFKDMLVDGHAPSLTGKDLTAYIAAGPDSDHECTNAGEAEEKLQKGMYIFMREGTAARNLLDLLPVMNAENSSRCCLCTDDRLPGDLLKRGDIDSMLRMAVDAGVSPVTAIQMATINTARRFGLRDRGAVAAGYRADLVVFEDLEKLGVRMVLKGGDMVAEGGELKIAMGEEPAVLSSTFNVAEFNSEKLRVPASGKNARVIGVIPDQIVTKALSLEVRIEGDLAVADMKKDILKIAVVERHAGTGNVGLGFVQGFGLTRGALASSVAHDSHNIVVVGASDEDMAAAVEKIIQMDGGQVVATGGEAVASLALPIAGLMSPISAQEVAAKLQKLNSSAADIGCKLGDPFIAMSFLALPVIPELKLTDRGLVDVKKFELVPLFVD